MPDLVLLRRREASWILGRKADSHRGASTEPHEKGESEWAAHITRENMKLAHYFSISAE